MHGIGRTKDQLLVEGMEAYKEASLVTMPTKASLLVTPNAHDPRAQLFPLTKSKQRCFNQRCVCGSTGRANMMLEHAE